MKADVMPVRWEPAHELTPCSECRELILVGQRMATYMDKGVEGYGHHFEIKRHYCEDCGKLLEDSLTTTEAI